VNLFWDQCRPLLEKATRRTHGRYEPEDLYREIMSGDQLLWVAWNQERNSIDAAMTSQFATYPRFKMHRILFCGGTHMKEWLADFREAVEELARKAGCKGVESAGREGWGRIWPGAQYEGAMFFKEL